MGNSPSLEYNLNLELFSIKFAHRDRLRLIFAPNDIVLLTEKTISQLWEIQEVKKSPGLVEYKLKGNPLTNTLSDENIQFKYLLCSLIKNYLEIGWHLEANMCLNRYGNSGSSLIFKRKEPLNTFVSCLSLDMGDKINVLGPENMIAVIKDSIVKNWPNGIQEERDTSVGNRQSYKFKLKGYPWTGVISEEKYNAPDLICSIFKALYGIGWVFYAAIETSENKINTLFFRYLPNSTTPTTEIFPLLFHRTDKINIINPPPFTIDLLRDTIVATWPKGLQDQQIKYNSFEFKLKGNPWLNYGEESVFSKRLINKIIENFRLKGYELYSICDTSSSDYKMSTFFLQKSPSPPRISPSRVLSVTFNESDKMRIIDDLNGFSNIVRDALKQGWSKGVKSESNFCGSLEFKLNGYAF